MVGNTTSPSNSSLSKVIPNKNPGKDVHNPNNAEGVISKLQLSKFRHQ